MGGDRAGGGRAAGPGGLGRVDPAGGGAGDAERAAGVGVVGEVGGGGVQKGGPPARHSQETGPEASTHSCQG